jgi:hypothetical protein
VTAPQDPGQPQYNPYGQPGSYRAGQQPGQYSSAPLPDQYQGYNPYGNPYPTGLDEGHDTPVTRPGVLVLGFVLMILAALPFVFAGLVGLFAPIDASVIPAELLKDPRFVSAGATPELLVSALRVLAGILLVIALIYLLFAFFAFRGRNWARILVTLLSVGFALLLGASLVTGTSSVEVLGFVGFEVVALVGSVVILFLPASSRFFARL